MINGSGGGGKSIGCGVGTNWAVSRKADPYKQSLRSNSVAEVVDILCEGPIRGLVAEIDEGEAYRGKSIAFDDTPLMSPAGVDNFSNYRVRLRKGTASQNPIQVNHDLQTTIIYEPSIELTEEGVSREVDLPDADSLKIILCAPAFYGLKKRDGSFYDASVQFSILVNGYEAYHTGFSGQTTGAYQRQYELTDLSRWGSNPWTIQIVLDEGYYHSDQTYIHDRIYWTATIGVTAERLFWPYVAHASVQVGARKFGGNVPTRAYEIYGYAECPMPDVYDPDSTDEDRFSGTWDGETWKYEWTDNPAWCWLAMLTNERFGLGVPLDDLGILKWQLCKIARYCDGFLPDTTERRWTFNAVLQTQEEAYHMLNSMASAFLAYPIWASNEVLIMQDAPDDPDNPADVNPTHIANQANVVGGSFNYSGSAINARHTVARITWNDPDDFGRPAIAYYENVQGIKRYGWRPKDIVATGCNSYSQAVRYGRWVIDTELNAGDVVTFIGDMSFGDCAPGCRFAVMDPHFADARFGGRLVSATSDESNTYLTLDAEVTLEIDTTYTIHFVMPMDSESVPDERQDQSTQIVSETILNSPQTTNTLTIALQSSLPEANAYWYISEPNLNPRYFTCIANEPQEGMQYKITGLYHDYSKYGRIYDDVIIPVAPESYVPSGIVAAPTNFTATEYSYESGNNWRPGVALAWSHIDDARVMYYQVDRKRLDADEEKTHWHNIGDTEDCSFNIEPCKAGDWSFRVRGMGFLNGEWAEIESFTVVGKTEDPPNVSNLTVKGGGTSFSTRALKLVWDTVIGEDYMPSARFLHYKVSLCDSDGDALLTKTVSSEYCQFSLSELANTYASPLSAFKVSCIAVDIYRQESPTPTVVTITPATPPTVTAVTVKGGGTTFTDRDCNLEWTEMVNNGISESRFWRYKVQIKTTGDEVKWTKYTTDNSLTFTRSQNLKAFGTLTREFKVGVAVVDTYRKVGTEQVATVSNPAPDMSAFTPTIKELTTGLRIDWSGWDDSAIPDLKQFRIYCDTDNPPTTLVAKLDAHRDRYKFDDGIKSYASHYVKIVPYDEFGEGVGSVVAASSGQDVNIDRPIEIASAGKIIAGEVAGARVEYSSSELAGYSDETTKEFEISSADGKIKAAGGAIAIGANGFLVKMGSQATNGVFWMSDASKVAGTDGAEYTCILNHVSSAANKPVTGANWATYWEKTGDASSVVWFSDHYYHVAGLDVTAILYANDDDIASTHLETRGDLIGADSLTRVLARCASGQKAQVVLRVNDSWIELTDDDGDVLLDFKSIDLTTAGQITSTKATGAPFVIASSTVCTNLNADLVDGKHAGVANGLATLGAGGLVPTSQLGTGTADNTVFLRGDGTWQATGAGASFNDAEGDPAKIGTAADGTSSYAARRDHVHACDDATTSVKGIAYFDSTNFMVNSGKVSLTTNGVPFIALPAFDTDKILGRSDSGSGPPSQITCTAAGRALLDDASATDQRNTLGLKGAAVLDVGTTTGTVAAGDDSRFVTGGNSHDHNGGDGAQISHANLSNIGTNSHSTIDSFISSKAQANGLASLNAFSLVVQNPANATGEAAPWKIPVADGNAKLDSWISTATTSTKGIASFSSTYFDVTTGAVSIKAAGVPYGRIQNISATDKILGRVSSGAGSIEEITCTAAGRALLDDASAAAQCTTLGLGTTDSPSFAGLTVSPSSRPVTISSGQVSMKGSAGGWTIGTRFLDSDSEAVGSFSAYGWDDDLVRYYLGTFESAELLSVTAAGLVGIGVINPTYNLEFAQGAARTIGIQRRTDSDSAGNFMYIQGGDATVAATNRNGGSLRLRPGLCTGSGYGQVQIYGCLGPGSGSSTTDGTYQELLTCRANKIGFFGGTPAVQQVLAAYTSDAESSAYTTTGSGSDIASKADLNALRTAYETLRSMCDDLRAKLLATTLIAS